jgi:hypothetical protein
VPDKVLSFEGSTIEPAPAPVAPLLVNLAISASAPIASLSIDGVVIPVSHSSREVRATVAGPTRDDGSRKVDAIAVDGRRSSALLSPGATSIAIRFQAIARAKRSPSNIAPAAPAASLPGPAADPYRH